MFRTSVNRHSFLQKIKISFRGAVCLCVLSENLYGNNPRTTQLRREYVYINIYIYIYMFVLRDFSRLNQKPNSKAKGRGGGANDIGSSNNWKGFYCRMVLRVHYTQNGWYEVSSFLCVCVQVSNKAFLPPLSTRLLCLVVSIPPVCWLYICACVCVPLYVHVKMCR